MDYSVLMSVYYKENPEYLKTAMLSMYHQSIMTNDFILVCDGPLTIDQNNVISHMKILFKNRLNIIRLEKNNGLGIALNEGIKYCKNELIARMDSDDISKPYRCEKQLEIFESHPEFDIVGGIIEEFSKSPENIISRRVVPEHHQEILKFAKTRNPFNHMTVMFKKSKVLKAGNYQSSYYLLEDYYLWIRMLQNGCLGYNIQEPLLYMRVSNETYKRRSGYKYTEAQRQLFKYMRDIGFIKYKVYIFNMFLRLIISMIPNIIRKIFYKTILRNK